MEKIKVVFMGTPEFSVPVLEMLINETEVVGVVTQPDKEVGRKRILTESPVARLAHVHHIPTFKPAKLRKEYENMCVTEKGLIGCNIHRIPADH